MGGIIGLVVTLVVLGVFFWLVMWFIGWIGVPEPFHKIILVIVGLVVFVIVANILLGLTGVNLSGPLFHYSRGG
jgi:hypothetical protein